jgi:hypothetical protein
LALNCRSFGVNCNRAAIYIFFYALSGAAGAGELIPEYNYADDSAAEDYSTPGSRPTDFENLLDIAI